MDYQVTRCHSRPSGFKTGYLVVLFKKKSRDAADAATKIQNYLLHIILLMVFIPTDILRINPKNYQWFVGSVGGENKTFNTYAEAVKAGAGEIKPAYKNGFDQNGIVQSRGDAHKAGAQPTKINPGEIVKTTVPQGGLSTAPQEHLDTVGKIEMDLNDQNNKQQNKLVEEQNKAQDAANSNFKSIDSKPADFIQTQIQKAQGEANLKKWQPVSQTTTPSGWFAGTAQTNNPSNRVGGIVKGDASVGAAGRMTPKGPNLQVQGAESNPNNTNQKISKVV